MTRRDASLRRLTGQAAGVGAVAAVVLLALRLLPVGDLLGDLQYMDWVWLISLVPAVATAVNFVGGGLLALALAGVVADWAVRPALVRAKRGHARARSATAVHPAGGPVRWLDPLLNPGPVRRRWCGALALAGVACLAGSVVVQRLGVYFVTDQSTVRWPLWFGDVTAVVSQMCRVTGGQVLGLLLLVASRDVLTARRWGRRVPG